jgi:hypothetical protein
MVHFDRDGTDDDGQEVKVEPSDNMDSLNLGAFN